MYLYVLIIKINNKIIIIIITIFIIINHNIIKIMTMEYKHAQNAYYIIIITIIIEYNILSCMHK